MPKFSSVNIDRIIQNYRNNLDIINNEYNNELFKWEALKQFQDVWFSEEYNDLSIHDKLKKALSKTSSLLYSQFEHSKDCLLRAFEFEPERASEALQRLFTHTDDLNERENNLYHFSAEIEAIKTVHFINYEFDKFTPYASSVLLALYAPSENYIFKRSKADLCCNLLNSYVDVSDNGQVKLIPYYEMCDAILEQLLSKKNKGLLDEHDKLIKEKGYYLDESRHWLVYDIIFSCDEKYLENIDHSSRDEAKKQYKIEITKQQIAKEIESLKAKIADKEKEIITKYDFVGMEVTNKYFGKGVIKEFSFGKTYEIVKVMFDTAGEKNIALNPGFRMELNTPDEEQIYKDIDEFDKMKTNLEKKEKMLNSNIIVD